NLEPNYAKCRCETPENRSHFSSDGRRRRKTNRKHSGRRIRFGMERKREEDVRHESRESAPPRKTAANSVRYRARERSAIDGQQQPSNVRGRIRRLCLYR